MQIASARNLTLCDHLSAVHIFRLGVFCRRHLCSFPEKSTDLNITTRANGIATIVNVCCDVTLYNAPELRKALMDLLKVKKAQRVIVDMNNVRYIDSAGVACLVESFKVARESKLGFALFGLNSEAKEVLELTRLIRVFEVYATEEQALSGAGLASSSSSGEAV